MSNPNEAPDEKIGKTVQVKTGREASAGRSTEALSGAAKQNRQGTINRGASTPGAANRCSGRARGAQRPDHLSDDQAPPHNATRATAIYVAENRRPAQHSPTAPANFIRRHYRLDPVRPPHKPCRRLQVLFTRKPTPS